MSVVRSILGNILSPLLVSVPFWAVKLDDGSFRSERDLVRDGNRQDEPGRPAGKRPFDWALDLVQSGEIHRVKELWLFCPPDRLNPLGQTVRLPIIERGTAFQFKIGYFDSNIAAGERSCVAQVIGRVDNKETGDCICFIYDRVLGGLIANWRSNVYHMGTWRPGEIAPMAAISPELHALSLS